MFTFAWVQTNRAKAQMENSQSLNDPDNKSCGASAPERLETLIRRVTHTQNRVIQDLEPKI